MRPRVVLFLIPALWLLSYGQRAYAYDVDPPVNRFYNVKVEYSEKQAVADTRDLRLTVTLNSLADAAGVAVPDSAVITGVSISSNDDSRIKVKSFGNVGGVYSFSVDIPAGVEPKTYKLMAEFAVQNKTVTQRYIDLNVGVRSQGKLRLLAAEEDTLVLGGEQQYTLLFANDFPEYTVNIDRIAVSSQLSELIEGVEVVPDGEVKASVENNVITLDPALSVNPMQQASLRLRLKLQRRPSLLNCITGFGEGTKLTFAVRYNDGHERSYSDFRPTVAVKVRPGDALLFWAMVLGVLVGTGIKFYIERPGKAGRKEKKAVAGFMLVTVAVGLVITIIAWGGELQIVAFKTDAISYDKPSVIFFIGFVGALSGVHYLYNRVKKLTGQDGAQGGEAQ